MTKYLSAHTDRTSTTPQTERRLAGRQPESRQTALATRCRSTCSRQTSTRVTPLPQAEPIAPKADRWGDATAPTTSSAAAFAARVDPGGYSPQSGADSAYTAVGGLNDSRGSRPSAIATTLRLVLFTWEVNESVEIDFGDRVLERVLTNGAAMTRELGQLRARRVAVRLAALRAVDCAIELLPLPGRWHMLTGNWKGHMSGDLDHPYRLLVRPQAPVLRTDDGGVAWAATRAMTVVGIFDTH